MNSAADKILNRPFEKLPSPGKNGPKRKRRRATAVAKKGSRSAVAQIATTSNEFLKRHAIASQEGIPPYNWIPPIWEGGDNDPPPLDDTVTGDVEFPEPTFEKVRQAETQPGEEEPDANNGQFNKWPHPRSDFSHIDPNQFDEADFKIAKAKLGATTPEFKKLKTFLGPESKGMQRLGRVFEWALTQATRILADLNYALTKPSKPAYIKARRAYIDLIKDLDDHEPQCKHGHVVPGYSGYGSCVKWAYIDPVIWKGKLKGACVVMLWNPHSSSSGVPIDHG